MMMMMMIVPWALGSLVLVEDKGEWDLVSQMPLTSLSLLSRKIPFFFRGQNFYWGFVKNFYWGFV